jgi:hypothetical protein
MKTTDLGSGVTEAIGGGNHYHVEVTSVAGIIPVREHCKNVAHPDSNRQPVGRDD